jgi:uncharacterized protein YwqG
MNNNEKEFEIIRFIPDSKRYYPASMERESWMRGVYVNHTEIEIPIGKSRYGGPVFDLPKSLEYPDGFRFAAQLDLAEFSPFDKTGLLPKTGQLIFFSDLMSGTGKVIYANVPNEELIRHTIEHEDNFWDGVLIDKIFAETETLSERFTEPEDDDEETNEDGKVWDYFAGTEKSKIFGIYTNCQCGQEETEEVAFSEKILLLQVGEEGFNDEGVFSVLINKKDLENRNFDNCEFSWGQS